MKRRGGVLFTGCGAYDGSDPHEAVLAMLCLQQAGIEVVPIVINDQQFHVVNHCSAQEDEGGPRSMATESARLVRGRIWYLEELAPKLLELLVIPGGQGSIKNLFTGSEGVAARTILPVVHDFIHGVHAAGGAIGAISLGEFVVSAALGPWPDGKGCLDVAADGILIDPGKRRVLTPGYILAGNLPELHRGIEKMTHALLDLLDSSSTTST